MKKKIFLTIVVFFTTFGGAYFPINSSSAYSENAQVTIHKNGDYIHKKIIRKPTLTKKDIKKQIKKKKKYHRTLLEKYNKSFDEKYLNLISENSLILDLLRKELKN